MEVLFELRRVNNRSVRVVAIDPITQTEVIMVGDYRQGESTLKRLAARKLQYVLKKKMAEAEARLKNR
jgi:hypothetical protein